MYGATYVRAANGWLVAELPRGAFTEDTANLLAAAPQLLEACKLLIAYRDKNTLNFQLEKADDFIRMMRAAIAAAEGAP